MSPCNLATPAVFGVLKYHCESEKKALPRIGEIFYSSVMELKVKLKNLMNGKGLNGQRLARLSQVSDSEISRILQGKSRPGLDNALRLAQALGVSLDYLADDKLDSEPPEPADSLSPEERKILGIIQKIGYPEVVTILENLRFLGYEVAMSRLVEPGRQARAKRICPASVPRSRPRPRYPLAPVRSRPDLGLELSERENRLRLLHLQIREPE